MLMQPTSVVHQLPTTFRYYGMPPHQDLLCFFRKKVILSVLQFRLTEIHKDFQVECEYLSVIPWHSLKYHLTS